jgi:hypothetical protein
MFSSNELCDQIIEKDFVFVFRKERRNLSMDRAGTSPGKNLTKLFLVIGSLVKV